MAKKYFCIKQHDMTDCGAACIATVSKQYGLKIPISMIREIAGTDSQGTTAMGVIKAASELGFNAKAVKGDVSAFLSKGFPLPAIAHVVVDDAVTHYIVIHKITRTFVIVADPAKGILKLSMRNFLKIWTGVLILLTPNVSFEKGNLQKPIWQRFFSLLIPQRALIINIFLASLIYTFLGLAGSFYFKILMDEILPNSLEKTLLIISIGIVLLNIFKSILSFFRSYLMLYLGQRLDIILLLGYFEHVLKLPMNFFTSRKVGEIISRFSDASRLRDILSSATLTIMIDSLMVVGGGFILYLQNSDLFFIAFIIAILYVITILVFSEPLKKLNETYMQENAELSSYMIESLNGAETVKSFNLEEKVFTETEKRFIKFLTSVFKTGTLSTIENTLTDTFSVLGTLTITWVGATKVLEGSLTIGQLLTFNALLAYFLNPIKNLIDLQPSIQSGMVAAKRLAEILDLEFEKNNESRKISPNHLGDILIKNLSFRYGTRQLVLENINMQINRGDKVALVGESGSGKTTLVKLLLNLYPFESGEIYIDKNNIKDISLDTLRDKVAYIPQNIFMYSGTILENFRLIKSDVTMEEIIEICKKVQIDSFINELPLRYNTQLSENASNLSGGQRQRLAIARALLKQPEILILDEATSNLDSITEKAIEKVIFESTQDITTIIIAHRLSTIMNCDIIYVFDKGSIVEYGSHYELMRHGGFYYELWKEQFPKDVYRRTTHEY